MAIHTQLCVPVTEASQPSAARRAAVQLAQEAGLDEAAGGGVALIATELATNLVKHGRGGEVLLRRLGPGGDEGVEILSLDKGPGIQDVGKALRDGYSTAGSPGTGLGAIVRTAGEFDLYATPGKGTAAVARIFARGRRAAAGPAHSIGAVHRAKPGETVCGDAWLARRFADGWLCAVADGLGHGPLAAAAARPIIEAVRSASGGLSPAALVAAAHDAAKPTRGAAFAVAVLDGRAEVVRFAGVGNIAALMLNGEERRQFVSSNGILGHEYRKVNEYSHPWRKQSVLVMHSDGLGTQWDVTQYPGLLARDASLIAGVLYRDYSRGRDDVTVVVIKERVG